MLMGMIDGNTQTSGGGGAASLFASPANTGTWTYSGGNATVLCTALATVNGHNSGQVLTVSAISGKQAFIVNVDTLTNNFTSVGISDGTLQGALGFSAGTNTIGWYSNSGGVFCNGAQISTVNPNVTAGLYGLFIDTAATLAWATTDGTNFIGASGSNRTAAEVAAGTDGLSFAGDLGASVFGAVSALDASGQQFTKQTSLPGGWTMPSGFSLL